MSKTSRKSGRPKIEPVNKKKYNDKIICDICNGEFSRSARSRHNKSQKHQAMLKINDFVKLNILKDQTHEFEDICMIPFRDRLGNELWMTKKQAALSNGAMQAAGKPPMYILQQDHIKSQRLLKNKDMPKKGQKVFLKQYGGRKSVKARDKAIEAQKKNHIDIDSDDDNIQSDDNPKAIQAKIRQLARSRLK